PATAIASSRPTASSGSCRCCGAASSSSRPARRTCQASRSSSVAAQRTASRPSSSPPRKRGASSPGLDAPRFLGGEELERDAVRCAATLELLEAWQVRRAGRDDELAAPQQRQLPLDAVGRELAIAVAGEPRLQRVGAVVEAGVEDARITAARVQATRLLLLEQ